jgi:hypothetical protein
VCGLTLLGLALGKVRQADKGIEKVDEALTLAKQVKKSGDFFLTYLVKGELLLMETHVGSGKLSNVSARPSKLHGNNSAKSDELRVTISLARLLA